MRNKHKIEKHPALCSDRWKNQWVDKSNIHFWFKIIHRHVILFFHDYETYCTFSMFCGLRSRPRSSERPRILTTVQSQKGEWIHMGDRLRLSTQTWRSVLPKQQTTWNLVQLANTSSHGLSSPLRDRTTGQDGTGKTSGEKWRVTTDRYWNKFEELIKIFKSIFKLAALLTDVIWMLNNDIINLRNRFNNVIYSYAWSQNQLKLQSLV